MNAIIDFNDKLNLNCKRRSLSAEGLVTPFPSPVMKIPMPPRPWITGKLIIKNALRNKQ